MKVHVLDVLPEGFLDCDPSRLYEILPGPTLLKLEGRRKPPILISTLLHGNETSGLLAIQDTLKQFAGQTLPRSLWLLIGNVEAAREGLRRLAHQEDFNRVWDHGTSMGQRWAQSVVDEVTAETLFLNVDIHNNTGHNPSYSCVTELSPKFLWLAQQFSSKVVYFQRPNNVQSLRFSEHCPSITIECGKIGDPTAVDKVVCFLKQILAYDEVSDKVSPQDFTLYQSQETLLVPAGKKVVFADELGKADICFPPNLDQLNFEPLKKGFPFAKIRGESPLLVVDAQNNDVTDSYFRIQDNQLILNQDVVPSMLTCDPKIVELDCLGYFMQVLEIA